MDTLKPFRLRHKIMFGNRRGFIRLAIQEQVPIYPMISVGAHETLFFLNDGKRFAELTGISRFLRIKSVPLALSFPLGLTPAGVLSIPLPSKIVIRILPGIELGEKPEAASDAQVVERCFNHVVQTMQRSLTDLASKRKHIVLG
jgi:1-acyl-sn-glycerol-3-phosphate acyltransferase